MTSSIIGTMMRASIGALFACCLLALSAGTAKAGFDLGPIPMSPVGDKAWAIERNGLCTTASYHRSMVFAVAVRRFIADSAHVVNAPPRALTPSITARYERWHTAYAITFDLSRPIDLDWLANCFHVGGADVPEAQRRGLHVQAAPKNEVDFEFSPDVGFYYVVHEVRERPAR